MLTKIISGAQTGADQAGLAAAIDLGLDTGGCMPRGRRTNVGPLSIELFRRWRLKEHSSWAYPPRTEVNVMESDGTVVFGNLNSPGCVLTIKLCKKWNKPCIGNPVSPEALMAWVTEKKIQVLNVAGNREETNPGIFERVKQFIVLAFTPARTV